MNKVLIVILLFLPVLIPGHARNLLGWHNSFVIFSSIYFIIGYNYTLNKKSIYTYNILLSIGTFIFPVVVYFTSKEFWYPYIIYIYLLVALISFFSGYQLYNKKLIHTLIGGLITFLMVEESGSNINLLIFRNKLNPTEYKYLVGINPSLTLYTLNGDRINPLYFRNKIVIVDFWFLSCKVCNDKLISYEKLVEFFRNRKDVTFISVLNNKIDSLNKIKDFVRRNNIKFLIAYDRAGEMEDKYHIGTSGYPVELRIDKSGSIVEVVTGFVTPQLYFNEGVNTINNEIQKQ